MLDESVFSNTRSIPEVYFLARKLKSEGHDIAEVNRLATIRKKELVSSSNTVNSLMKVVPKAGSTRKGKVSRFILKVENLNSSTITLTTDGTVIL